MKKLLITGAVFLFSLLSLPAQKQGNIWYFGVRAGLDFNSGKPVPIYDGKIQTEEGCATICDANGKLLFYTDGISVWNRQHNTMPNGTGLLGHSSSTQSGVIVPKPLDKNLYYVFTVPDKSQNYGFRYSIVDMRLDNGLGDVTEEKNVMLEPSSVEKVTAVLHKNKTDIWVIMHQWNSNRFKAYLVTRNGINSVENGYPGYPVISDIGMIHSGNQFNKIGYLKASPDGSKIALAVNMDGVFQLFDFDNETGKITDPVVTFSGPEYKLAYGVEFSPNGRFLYLSSEDESGSGVYQLDLNAGSSQDIINSRVLISKLVKERYYYSALQVAPDHKIYMAKYNRTFLDVINEPNKKGLACGYQENAVELSPSICLWGLPTFIQSYFFIDLSVGSNSPVCEGEDIYLYCDELPDATYEWTGPDGFSSNEREPIIHNAGFNASGKYLIKVTQYGYNQYDTVEVTVNQKPLADAGNDMTICEGQSVKIGAGASGGSGVYYYRWLPSKWLSSDSSATPVATPLVTTEYIMTVYDENGCLDKDSVLITVYPIPKIKVIPDTEICQGDAIQIASDVTGGSGEYTVEWSPEAGLSDALIPNPIASPDKTTTYHLKIHDANGCDVFDTVTIVVHPAPPAYAGDDITICYQIGKQIGNPDAPKDLEYEWWPPVWLDDYKSPAPIATPDRNITYHLKVTSDNGCVNYDSVNVHVFNGFADVSIDCPQENLSTGHRFRMPVKVKLPDYSFGIGITGIQITLRYRADLLIPVNNQIVNDIIEYPQRTTTFFFPFDDRINTEQTLYLTFDPGLAKDHYSDLIIENVVFTDGDCPVPANIHNGCIDVQPVCMNYTIQYFDNMLTLMNESGNPVSGDLSLLINSGSAQELNISLMNLTGRKVLGIYNGIIQKGTSRINSSLDNIADGMYFLIIKTANSCYTEKLLIMK